MNYEQWLNIIEDLKATSINVDKLNLIKNAELNTNIQDILEPKLINLINTKFENSVNKIIKDLGMMFSDINYLDMKLIDFKKEINFIKELIELKQISQSSKNDLYNTLSQRINSVYDILLKEANLSDQTGIYAITITNNRIKWSD